MLALVLRLSALLLLAITLSNAQLIYRDKVNGLRLGKVTFLKSFSDDTMVTHMEEDLHKAGSIIYSTFYGLWTMNLQTLKVKLIVGNDNNTVSYQEGIGSQARFNGIYGFTQLSSEQVIVADGLNDCIRLVDRVSGETSKLAGRCGSDTMPSEPANKTHTFDESRFPEPYKIIKHPSIGSRYLITQLGRTAADIGSRISIIDLESQHVQVLELRPQIMKPKDLVFSADNTLAYVSGSGLLSTLDISSLTTTSLTTPAVRNKQSSDNSDTYIDGMLSDVTVSDPEEIALINEHVLIVTTHTKVLKVINLITNKTSSVCEAGSVRRNKEGEIGNCQLNKPMSLLYLRESSRLLIGTRRGIMQLEVEDTTRVMSSTGYPTSTNSGHGDRAHLNTGALIGGVVAGICLLIIIAVLLAVLICRRKAQSEKPISQYQEEAGKTLEASSGYYETIDVSRAGVPRQDSQDYYSYIIDTNQGQAYNNINLKPPVPSSNPPSAGVSAPGTVSRDNSFEYSYAVGNAISKISDIKSGRDNSESAYCDIGESIEECDEVTDLVDNSTELPKAVRSDSTGYIDFNTADFIHRPQ